MQPTSYINSYPHFQRYEKFLSDIVSSWPSVIRFTPTPPLTSAESLASRIRICIKALRENIQSNEPNWPTTIDALKFVQICDEIRVSTSIEPGKVLCGPYESLRKKTALGTEVETVGDQITSLINLKNPSVEVIMAIFILHHAQVFTAPSVIVTDLDLTQYEKSYDVAVTRSGNTYTIL